MNQIQNNERTKKIGASPDDWVVLNAQYTIQREVYGLQKDGQYFYHQKTIDSTGIDLLEFSETRSHILNVDGDESMVTKEIVQQFYEDGNIEVIYGEENSNDIDLFLVLNQEVEQLDLQLAKLQNKISKQYPNYNIEIMYTTKDFFDRDSISSGSIAYPRR